MWSKSEERKKTSNNEPRIRISGVWMQIEIKTTFSAGLQHHSADAGCGAQAERAQPEKKAQG